MPTEITFDPSCKTNHRGRVGPDVYKTVITHTDSDETAEISVLHSDGVQVSYDENGDQRFISVLLSYGRGGLYTAYTAEQAIELGEALIRSGEYLKEIENGQTSNVSGDA